jgi:hypothetical protein
MIELNINRSIVNVFGFFSTYTGDTNEQPTVVAEGTSQELPAYLEGILICLKYCTF